MTMTIALNGTDKNPYDPFGLTQNPFPQLAHAELDRAGQQLNKLGGPSIPHDRYDAYIRETLTGHVSEELILLCIARFVPGRYVIFSVKWDEHGTRLPNYFKSEV